MEGTMGRRLTWLVLLGILVLWPASAWAAADPGHSDFATLYRDHGAIVAVLASFVFGVVASLTPCVYPMVPITVSIFGATSAPPRLRGAALSLSFVLGIA